MAKLSIIPSTENGDRLNAVRRAERGRKRAALIKQFMDDGLAMEDATEKAHKAMLRIPVPE